MTSWIGSVAKIFSINSTASEDLQKQVEREKADLENAPKVQIKQPTSLGTAGRCHWCGRISQNLVPVHDYNHAGTEIVNERYKGAECCGGRHV